MPFIIASDLKVKNRRGRIKNPINQEILITSNIDNHFNHKINRANRHEIANQCQIAFTKRNAQSALELDFTLSLF